MILMKKILPLGIVGYEFKDLNEEVQDKVIGEHIDFLIELMSGNEEIADDFREEIEEAERLQTPWFLGSIIYDNRKDDIIEMIEISEHLFDVDGNLLPITTHIRYTDMGEATIVKHTFSLSPANEVDVELIEGGY